MRYFRKQEGFTLVELIVTIAVGAIAAAAAVTVMILGLRIYNNANDKAGKLNQVQIALSAIEQLAAESEITEVDAGVIYTTDGKILLEQAGNQLVTGSGAPLMENVESFTAELKDKLLTVEITVEQEKYTFCVYCRRAPEATEDTTEASDPPASGNSEAGTVFSLRPEQDAEELLNLAVEDKALKPHVRAFLEVLSSQRGSTGRIQTPEGEGEYYSEWYIGGYEGKQDWNAETPWCACFVSWALEQCGGYIQGETPRYANVDAFWAELVTTQNWKDGSPEAGDLIFFDWSADGDYNPEHIGVVIGGDDSRVYTIEGNVGGRVALCSYAPDDARILGYGLINWTK